MKRKRPFLFARTSTAIASIILVGTLSAIAFLAGCDTPSALRAVSSVSSSEDKSETASMVFSQVPFPVKNVSELASYEDVPFQITSSTNGIPMEFWSFPEYWDNAVLCGPGHQYTLRQLYANPDNHPSMIPDQTTLTVSFGSYVPEAVTVYRDTHTYDKSSTEDIFPTETVKTSLSSDYQYSFLVDYQEERVLYYLISATWDNGNHVDYAIAVSPN